MRYNVRPRLLWAVASSGRRSSASR